jgi:hypothetical protein
MPPGKVLIRLPRRAPLTYNHSNTPVEHSFPRSELHKWEQSMPLPDVQQAARDSINTAPINSFMAQVKERKHANTIRTELR